MKRYLFLDLLKAIALIEMIHGHTLDALLSFSQKSSHFWIFWQNIRGFTAPLFLFASGIAFSISTLKRKEYFYISKKLLDRIRRIFFIIMLGYALHLPYFSLRKILFDLNFSDLNNFFNFDILQCIGISILILQIFYFISKDEKIFLKLVSFLTISFFFLTIYVSKNNLNLPLFLLKFFKNSLFPLTPFSIYLFSGCILGYFFLSYKNQNIFFFFSLFSFLIFLIFKIFSFKLDIIFLRISVLSFISFLLFYLENSKANFLKILQIFGKESLIVYFWHLPVVYGWVLNKGLRHYFSGKLSFSEVYLIFLLILIFFFLFTIFINHLKEKNKEIFSKIKYFVYFSFLAPFIFRSY
ncbi:MAG: heparan-alpha-glucosaminide N-acetyltransferase domain-containing protein [candidate division WOR-3 bacterium]